MHPLENAALSRRTPVADLNSIVVRVLSGVPMPEIKTAFLFTIVLEVEALILATRLMAIGALDGLVPVALRDRNSKA